MDGLSRDRLLSPWYNPISWIYLVVRICLQPPWFWDCVSPLFQERQWARRLLIQVILGAELLWVSAVGLGRLVGVVVPAIGEFYVIGWWLHSLIFIILTVLGALVLQTAYGHRKSVVYIAATGVFVVSYIVALLAAACVIQWTILFSDKELSRFILIDLNIPFFASFGFYMALVQLLEYQRLRKEMPWLQKLLALCLHFPLIVLWVALIIASQYWNFVYRAETNTLLGFIAGFIALAVTMQMIGLLLGLLFAASNAREDSSISHRRWR